MGATKAPILAPRIRTTFQIGRTREKRRDIILLLVYICFVAYSEIGAV